MSRQRTPADNRNTPGPVPALDAARRGAPAAVARAAQLATLDSAVSAALPWGLGSHVRVANVQADTLVMLADGPAWHHRLQRSADVVLAAARDAGAAVTVLKVRMAKEPLNARPGAAGTAARAGAVERETLARLRALLKPADN